MNMIPIIADYFDNFKWDELDYFISTHEYNTCDRFRVFAWMLEYKGYIVYLRNGILYIIDGEFYDVFSLENTFNIRDMMNIWYELTSPFRYPHKMS